MENHRSGRAYQAHGLSKTRLYRIWRNIKYRCNTETCKDFSHYGGRGIKLCEAWVNSFETFHAWAMDNGYSDDMTIDRIDVDGDYSPENCRWVTWLEQQNNKRDSVFITINGKTQTAKQWSRETGVCYTTILARLKSGVTGSDLIRKAVGA
jgi:hypothetical protein